MIDPVLTIQMQSEEFDNLTNALIIVLSEMDNLIPLWVFKDISPVL